MPTIKSSAELRNDYNGVSKLCHDYNETVFVTKNGKGDLAVMSIETYDNLLGRFELYTKLKEGLDDIQEGRTESFAEVLKNVQKRHKKRNLIFKFLYGLNKTFLEL